MGPCIVMCSREVIAPNQRQNIYVEPELPEKISHELDYEPVKQQETRANLADEVSKPLVERSSGRFAKSQHKSRFYKPNLRHSETLRTSRKRLMENQRLCNESGELIGYNSLPRLKRKDASQSQLSSRSAEIAPSDLEIIQIETSQSSGRQPIGELLLQSHSAKLRTEQLQADMETGLTDKDRQLFKLTQQLDQPIKINTQICFNNGSRYTGEWLKGRRHGKGTQTMADGSVYSGQWRNNKFEGIGTLTFANREMYKGEWAQGMAHGLGQFQFANGSTYRGQWVNNKQCGEGTEEWINGERYTGSWNNGKKNGFGQLYFQDGSYYKGTFVNNELQGEGEYSWHSKKLYRGDWEHNQMSGKGVLIWENGSRYEGEFKHGKMHGKGKQVNSDGVQYKGTWEMGRKTGIIEELRPDGKIKRGDWHFGKLLKYLDDSSSLKKMNKNERVSKRTSKK